MVACAMKYRICNRLIFIVGGMSIGLWLIGLICIALNCCLLEVPQTHCSENSAIVSYWAHFHTMNSWEKLKPLANGLCTAIIKDQVSWLDSDSISPLLWVEGKGFTGLRVEFIIGEGINEPESCQLIISSDLGDKPATTSARIPFEKVAPCTFIAAFPKSQCNRCVRADIKFAGNNRAFTGCGSYACYYKITPIDGTTAPLKLSYCQFLD